MKKLFIFIFMSIIFLNSCADLNAVKLKNDELGNLIDSKNSLLYYYCGSYLRAGEINTKVYAKGDKGEKLYEIPENEPQKWLSEDIKKLGMPLLFRASDVEEPSLENFGTTDIHITEAAEINVRIGIITGNDAQIIVKDYTKGKAIKEPDEIEKVVWLWFESPNYPNIFYVLQYLYGSDGNHYLYDRWTKRCVVCTINLG